MYIGIHMKFNKTLVSVLIAIVLIIVFFYLPKPSSPVSPPSTENPQTQTASVAVDFGEENVISNEFEVNNEITAYSLLQQIAQSENLTVNIDQYDFGIFVKAINEYESTAEKSWIYFVNGNSGDVAADQKQITAGDIVEWKYLAPNE